MRYFSLLKGLCQSRERQLVVPFFLDYSLRPHCFVHLYFFFSVLSVWLVLCRLLCDIFLLPSINLHLSVIVLTIKFPFLSLIFNSCFVGKFKLFVMRYIAGSYRKAFDIVQAQRCYFVTVFVFINSLGLCNYIFIILCTKIYLQRFLQKDLYLFFFGLIFTSISQRLLFTYHLFVCVYFVKIILVRIYWCKLLIISSAWKA